MFHFRAAWHAAPTQTPVRYVGLTSFGSRRGAMAAKTSQQAVMSGHGNCLLHVVMYERKVRVQTTMPPETSRYPEYLPTPARPVTETWTS